MPEAKKISELPLLSSVQPNDIVPIVDEAITQTSRCRASQIAAIGGGPPGANTVSTATIQGGAVTAEKIGFTGPDKLISRTAAGAGSGTEIACSPYARGLLAVGDANNARLYLDALQSTDSPTFTGQVRVAIGSAETPSIAGVIDPATGIFFPESEAVGISAGGRERWRITSDGVVLTTLFVDGGVPVLRPGYPARAWATFNGTSIASASITIQSNQRAVAERYGLSGTIGDNHATRVYMQSVEDGRGLALTFPSEPTFNDAYGKGTNIPAYNRGTETRANYTSAGDNKHWVWNGSNWVKTAASGLFWIGTVNLAFKALANTGPTAGAGIAAVTRTGTGEYTLTFSQPMPDANYCVVGSVGTNSAFIRLGSVSASSFSFVCRTDAGANVDPAIVNVAVFR